MASVPVPGHLNPLLSVGRILKKHRHEVVVQTSSVFRSSVEEAGMSLLPSPWEDGMDVEQYFKRYPERDEKTPGPEMICFDIKNYFLYNMRAMAEGLQLALRDFPADVILADSFFLGTIPLLLGERQQRPAIVHLGISVLNIFSEKSTPPSQDLSPERMRAERDDLERLLLLPIQEAANEVLAEMGCAALPVPLGESMSVLPDLYLHPGIKSFQFTKDASFASHVKYIGSLSVPTQHLLPAWWSELDRTKRLVLITQGTIANRDLGQLIAPALVGLSDEKDLILLVTTGGQPASSIPVEIPANAHIVDFLPYELVFPHVDLLITNGGYGTVNRALAHGIPIVSAGLTEDKGMVSAHVQWSGAGIDMRTNNPTPGAVRAAVRQILDSSVYRNRAKELAAEFARHDTEAELLGLIESCVSATVNV